MDIHVTHGGGSFKEAAFITLKTAEVANRRVVLTFNNVEIEVTRDSRIRLLEEEYLEKSALPPAPKNLDDVLSSLDSFAWREVENRERPYDGQSHTETGERGKTLVEGLTMRDVHDCIILGAFTASGIERKDWPDSIYDLPWGDMDPGAVIKRALCHIEKRMGIYPNIPKNGGEIDMVGAITPDGPAFVEEPERMTVDEAMKQNKCRHEGCANVPTHLCGKCGHGLCLDHTTLRFCKSETFLVCEGCLR